MFFFPATYPSYSSHFPRILQQSVSPAQFSCSTSLQFLFLAPNIVIVLILLFTNSLFPWYSNIDNGTLCLDIITSSVNHMIALDAPTVV